MNTEPDGPKILHDMLLVNLAIFAMIGIAVWKIWSWWM